MTAKDKGEPGVRDEVMLSASNRLLVAIAGAASLNRSGHLETLIPLALAQGILPEEIAAVCSIVAEVSGDSAEHTLDLVARMPEKPERTCCELDRKLKNRPLDPSGNLGQVRL